MKTQVFRVAERALFYTVPALIAIVVLISIF